MHCLDHRSRSLTRTPEVMGRLSAIEYAPLSDDYVKYEIWIDGKRDHETPRERVVAIDGPFPMGTLC